VCVVACVQEEQVSTALGYLCHLVQLTAKYLQVPLRYTPAHCASRSCMRDDVIRPTVEYPLYGKVPPASSPEAASSPFSIALLMLSRDVKQLLASQGLAMGDAHMLAALRRLFSVLLDAPVPTTGSGPAGLDAGSGGAAAVPDPAGGGEVGLRSSAPAGLSGSVGSSRGAAAASGGSSVASDAAMLRGASFLLR
jgi:hypothetical protein